MEVIIEGRKHKHLPNQDVGTPDRGDGFVLGWTLDENGVEKVLVRLRVKADVPKGEKKSKSCNGWQFPYDENALTEPAGKQKK